jgi:hypothetical protein
MLSFQHTHEFWKQPKSAGAKSGEYGRQSMAQMPFPAQKEGGKNTATFKVKNMLAHCRRINEQSLHKSPRLRLMASISLFNTST